MKIKVLLLTVFTASIVNAQRPASEGDWDISLGIGSMVKAKYEGSSDYDIWPIPYFDIRYKDSFYLSPGAGLGYEAKTESGIKYDLSLGFDFGRDEEDGDILIGMDDIDFGLLARFGLSYEWNKIDWKIRYKQAFTGVHDGYGIEFGLGKRFYMRESRSILNLSLTSTYQSDDYMQTYFGVSEVESMRSGHPVYQIDAGLKDVTLGAIFIRPINGDWSIFGMLRYSQFLSDVKDSPIVESDHRIFGGLFFVRKL